MFEESQQNQDQNGMNTEMSSNKMNKEQDEYISQFIVDFNDLPES